MKAEKLNLTTPKTSKLYSYRKIGAEKFFETSSGTDVTTTCTSVASSTHFNKI
ncbi:hypothetical protein [Mucilaginibacter sp. FT3.2]|uniref:hypothetical protein n=1 Tax=Mucilaginibacter sp. FT3.2 TaxID=2723090 RepID=UPI001609FFFB|nr:hypothetical protein [Mucilaginibacter sp. FT3.2]MBB6235297.1 hypothetical protein [Mucilaginibacter sp. FT3.2]